MADPSIEIKVNIKSEITKGIKWLGVKVNLTILNFENACVSPRADHVIIVLACITNPSFIVMASSTCSDQFIIWASNACAVEAASIIKVFIKYKPVFFIAKTLKRTIFI